MKTTKRNIRNIFLFLAGLLAAQSASAFYDPSTGRWLSRDPIGEPGFQLVQNASSAVQVVGSSAKTSSSRWIVRERLTERTEANLYCFVHNNPPNNYDPHGLDSFWDPNIPTPQLPNPGDVPDSAKGCLTAPDLPSTSSECNKYGGKTYYGASLSCFCKCAGDSDWSKMVRGCLSCMEDKGVPVGDAHSYCYIAADAKHSRPWATLAKCLCKCQ